MSVCHGAPRRSARGFTLLEVTVVLAVVAALAAAATLSHARIGASAADRATLASAKVVGDSVAVLLSSEKPPVVDRELLESLEVSHGASAPGVSAASSRFSFTDGVSADPTQVSFFAVSSRKVNLALVSPTGACAHVRVDLDESLGAPELSSGVCAASGSPAWVAAHDTPAPPSSAVPTSSVPPTTALGPVWSAGPLAAAGDVSFAGDVTIVGGPLLASGSVTASGSVSTEGVFAGGPVLCSGITACGSGQASAQNLGTVVVTSQTVPLPPSARSLWDDYRDAFVWGTLNYAGTEFVPGAWFDLCGDGTVRLPDGGVPCAGSLVRAADAPSDWVGFEGWVFDAGAKVWVSRQGVGAGTSLPFGPAPAWVNPGRSRVSAVFYVAGASARLEGSNGGPITVLVEASADPATGNLDVGGAGPLYEPVLGGVLFVADGDVRLRSSAPYLGFSSSGERFDAGGNTRYTGSIRAAGAQDRAGSLLGPGPAVSFGAKVHLNFQP